MNLSDTEQYKKFKAWKEPQLLKDDEFIRKETLELCIREDYIICELRMCGLDYYVITRTPAIKACIEVGIREDWNSLRVCCEVIKILLDNNKVLLEQLMKHPFDNGLIIE